MRILPHLNIFICVLCLLVPSSAFARKDFMGGKGTLVVEKAPAEVPPDHGIPDTVEGPLNDKMADTGKLFGDLYRILRQQGIDGDKKLVPQVNALGEPVTEGTNVFNYTIDGTTYTYTVDVQLFVTVENGAITPEAVVGGEPVLTVLDPGDPGVNESFVDYGWYAAEIGINADDTLVYGAAQSPYPAQCVQPVADYARWGDISARSGLTKNRLPMVITYDATWNRSECAIGKLDGPVVADPVTGELTIPIDSYFIPPGETWSDENNGTVTYEEGVLWTDLVGEVGFGRLNISRAPEAVLESAFDEAVMTINSADTTAIEIDAAGRLLLTKNVYSPLLVDPTDGAPLLIGSVKKAIDSPLENVALYVKLMQDGHLVTPGDEREPIDRSQFGGVPLWKLLELEDGPADAFLRPTIDIDKLRSFGLDALVDVNETVYFTYYQCVDADGAVTECLCWNDDPVQPELPGEWVMCENVVERTLVVVDVCPAGIDCEGPFIGIKTDGDYAPDAADLEFTAGFLAAAADKTGHMSVDMIVYLNSILGINLVLGTNEEETIDYEKNPVYFNFRAVAGYDRASTFAERGIVAVPSDGDGTAATYTGQVKVLQGLSPTWTETLVDIILATMGGDTIFDDIGQALDTGFPDESTAADNILGFTQLSDDDLSVIRFVHTFQIPGLR